MSILKRIFLNEWVVVSAIMLNSILLFLMGFEQLKYKNYLEVTDYLFTLFFIVEIFVKVSYYGWYKYWGNSWNKFDFFLVAISTPSLLEMFMYVPDISYLLVFRLLRVLRILRFMRFIPNIKKMIEGIQRAFRASAFIFAALLIYNVLLAVLSTYLFRDEAPQHFGNPLLSLYSIFQIFTMEGWNQIPTDIITNMDGASFKPVFTRLYFVIVVLTGSIFGFSILNAIFVDEMVSDNNEGLEDKVDKLTEKVDRLLAERDGGNTDS